MTFPLYQSTGGIGTGTAFSCDVPYPSTVNEFDILITPVMDADDDSFDIPAGWTVIDSETMHNNLSVTYYWLRATGSETGTETFTSALDSGALVAGIMYRYSGCVKFGIPYEQELREAVHQSTSVLPDFDGDALGTQRLAVAIGIVEDNTINAFTANGFTEDSRLSTAVGSDAHFAAASLEMSSTTEPTACTWGMSANEYHSSLGFYLIPDPEIDVTLNSPADLEDIGDDTTPTVEFTGDAVSNLDIEYEVQIDLVNDFSESTDTFYFDGSDVVASDPDGQWTNETNTDDGSTGTFGVSDTTSGTESFGYVEIQGTNASGIENRKIESVRARYRTISTYQSYFDLSPPVGGWSIAALQSLEVRAWLVGPTMNCTIYEDGNAGGTNLGSDSNASGASLSIIEIEVTWAIDVQALSETPDAGFLNTVDGGDTHPFNDNEKISYTVQGGDELPYGTVYWRVRAKNPTGINVFDDWSAIREFDITENGGPVRRIFNIT